MRRYLCFLFTILAWAAPSSEKHKPNVGPEAPAPSIVSDYPFLVEDYADVQDCKDLVDAAKFLQSVSEKDVLSSCVEQKNKTQDIVKEAATLCATLNAAVKKLDGQAESFNTKYEGADEITDAQKKDLEALMQQVPALLQVEAKVTSAHLLAKTSLAELQTCQRGAPYPNCPQESAGLAGIEKCVGECPETASLNDVTGQCEPDCMGDNQTQFSDPSTGVVSCRGSCGEDKELDDFGRCKPIFKVGADQCKIGKGRKRRGGELVTLPNKKVRCLYPCRGERFRDAKGRCVKSRQPSQRAELEPCVYGKGKRARPGEWVPMPNGKRVCKALCPHHKIRGPRGGCIKAKPDAVKLPIPKNIPITNEEF